MPDRHGFNGPFADGTISCIDCNQRFTAGLPEAKRRRHQQSHEIEQRRERERRQRAQLREARRLKALADREARKLEERGLY